MEQERILVVEDHDLLLLAIRDILEMEGYEVETAIDGVDALEKMQERIPDLIVADIMMPRMDGYALFEEVRSYPRWVQIPFIFLTARAEKEDRLKGKALGAEDYITKPFDPQELIIAVRARLGRAQAIREASIAEFESLKQQIITLLSHELRTPLTSVYGYTELALEEAANLPPGDFQQFLMGIKHGADRLTRLVEDLLMLVRIDTGQLDREFQLLSVMHTNLSQTVQHVANLYLQAAQEKGIELKVEAEPNLPPVHVYEPFLFDAIGRLIDNAIKFSRKKGKTVWVNAVRLGDWVEVSVSDEGVGISPEKVEALFERFRQVNREKMEQQGAGLGLVITREVIRCMGGDVTVESQLDVGSTFTIRLPVAEEATEG